MYRIKLETQSIKLCESFAKKKLKLKSSNPIPVFSTL